jgi:hypothetical protein
MGGRRVGHPRAPGSLLHGLGGQIRGVVIMQNGAKVADAKKDEMTAEELEHVIRDGGRQVGEAAD